MKFADLHLHTNFSDGDYSPERLITESINCGLSAIAIVDHDTVCAIKPALDEARGKDIEVLAGIELTAEYDNAEIHILGYLIDYENNLLLEKLKVLKQNRIERIYKIAAKLKDRMGVNLRPDEVFAIAGKGTVGRLHVARALVKAGTAESIFEAFRKFIGDKSPGYIAGFKLSPTDAIKLIREVGGISVLAHPYTINNDTLVIKLIDNGLMGLEVYYPEHSQGTINFYLNLAKKHNLLVTGGSDCHGTAKPEVKLGTIKIPYELVEELKQAKARIR